MSRQKSIILTLLIFLVPAIAYSQEGALENLPPQVVDIHKFTEWLEQEFKYCIEIPNELHAPKDTIKSRKGDCVVIIKFTDLKIRHAICAWKDERGLSGRISAS